MNLLFETQNQDGDSKTHSFLCLGCLTADVTRWWAGRDNATLTEPTSSHAKCLKTRRLPPVGCTSGERERPLSPKKQDALGIYCKWQTHKPYTTVETHDCCRPAVHLGFRSQ